MVNLLVVGNMLYVPCAPFVFIVITKGCEIWNANKSSELYPNDLMELLLKHHSHQAFVQLEILYLLISFGGLQSAGQ